MRFFDQYDRFYQTTATLLKPNRFQQRWRMIVAQNRQLFEGARVLDLASHDGRWAFAALKAGAAYVEGVEGRAELVQSSFDNFNAYGIDPARYSFVCKDLVRYLSAENLESFDVVLNLGFFYHTLRHMEIIENMARTNAKYFVFDTGLIDAEEALILVRREAVADPRNAIDHRGAGADSVPIGIVSRAALTLMLDSVGYDCNEVDWRSLVTDFSECEEYAAGGRGTFVARRRDPNSNAPAP